MVEGKHIKGSLFPITVKLPPVWKLGTLTKTSEKAMGCSGQPERRGHNSSEHKQGGEKPLHFHLQPNRRETVII